MADSFPIIKTVDLESAWTATSDYHNFDLFPATLQGAIKSLAFSLNSPTTTAGAQPSLLAAIKVRQRGEEDRQTIWSQLVEFPGYGDFAEFSDRIAIPEYLSALECDVHRTQGDRSQFGTLTIVAWFDREDSDE